MNTPITDSHFTGPCNRLDNVRSRELCRRLELDRAALMQALAAVLEWEPRDKDDEEKLVYQEARATFAAVRANFPTE